jgi:ring-1,2-phenylacetyl-CoA epoxidase subunit PaaD
MVTAAPAAAPDRPAPPERPQVAQVWDWLAQVEDPEIPVISIVDLGIVREVAWSGDECVVTITPTYSGCPATHVIAESIEQALQERGIARVKLVNRIAPAWTTDWMSEDGKRKLHAYGIAAPVGLAAGQRIAVKDIGRGVPPLRPPQPGCPHCGSHAVRLTSQFGSTPCKALYVCTSCSEPFDHFKCH